MEARSYDIVIVGSGPSGLLTAILASPSLKILLLERPGREHVLGKRILVSGNGRANFFNEDLLQETNYQDSFLSPMKEIVFSSSHNYAEEFLEYLTKDLLFPVRKEGKLYYPYFGRSECLQNVLLQELSKRKNVHVVFATMEEWKEKNRSISYRREDGRKEDVFYQKLVLALGGKSLDRDNLNNSFLSSFASYPFSPALCPVKVQEKIPSYLNKNRLKGKLVLQEDGKEIYQEEGELLFKEDGISGICVFDSTLYYLNARRKNPHALFTYDFTYLEEPCSFSSYPSFLRRYLSEEKKKPGTMHFTLSSLYPFFQSQISYGGVLLSEIDPDTMAWKKNDHIYLLGEMLDQNFPCGGYNMGMALIEGYKLGKELSHDIHGR